MALGLHDLPLFSLTVLVLNATPGVDLVFTVTRTLQQGPRAGLAGAAGISAGCAVHALAATFGLAALLAVSGTAFAVIKWAGAAYLAWMALGMLRSAWTAPADPPEASPAPRRARAPAPLWPVFRQGLITNVLNPKVAMFFLAFLPQFIDAAAPHKTQAFLVLGGWFVLQSALFLATLVALTTRLQRLGGSPRLGRWLNGLGGGLFLVLAVRLARLEPDAP
jgi:threonine/homoserine/homoserine lactone efflux protein